MDEKTVENLPDSSGVYIFRDKNKKVIYVGKAKNIKERVRSYIRDGKRDPKTELLTEKIADVDTILTGSEKEAFLLENNLIKEYKPRYNINLKDDKTYVSIKLTVQEKFPGLYVTRKIENDGAMYFGPYPGAGDTRDVLKVAQSIYPIRRCKNTVFRKRRRACILYQMGKCAAPCEDKIKEAEYKNIVAELIDFLSGRDRKLLGDLLKNIQKASDEWRFEEAKALKDRYEAIQKLIEKQNVHEHMGKNRDVWGFLGEKSVLKIVLLSFRRGVLISKKTFKKPYVSTSLEDAISSFLFQYYDTRVVPDEIILSHSIEDAKILEDFLKSTKNKAVRVRGQTDDTSKSLIALAIENLFEKKQIPLHKAFKKIFHLKREPVRIEAYDISHIHGKNPTGVMVAFESFKEDKDAYRVFHIRGKATMDDTSSIKEVLSRRLTDKKIKPLPDMFIIDGGKSQLSSAVSVLKELQIERDIIGIAKGEKRHGMKDLIYIPMRKNPVLLPKSSPVLRQLVRIRDEAHRFAVFSHRRWKKKEDLQN